MSSPKMVGIRDVINPVEGLQDTVSRVGDIYKTYEQDRRSSELHAEQMAESRRAEKTREYVRSYTPEFGGADLKGIDEDTRVALTQMEKGILQSLGPDATPEEYRRVTDEMTNRRKQLVTREAAASAIYNDMLRNGVDANVAQGFAANEAGKYQSIDAMLAAETEKAKFQQEGDYKRAQLVIDAIKARNTGLDSYSRTTGETTSGGGSNGGGGFSGGTKVFENEAQVEEYLDEEIGSRDSSRAMQNIKKGMNQLNNERVLAGKKPVSYSEVSNLIALSATKNLWDNHVTLNSPGEWTVAMEKYLSTSGGSGRGSARTTTTAAEENALMAALSGRPVNIPTRAQLAAMRVRGLYGDLLHKKGDTATPQGNPSIRVLGGKGREDLSSLKRTAPAPAVRPAANNQDLSVALSEPILTAPERERIAARFNNSQNKVYRVDGANRDLTRFTNGASSTSPTVPAPEQLRRLKLLEQNPPAPARTLSRVKREED